MQTRIVTVELGTGPDPEGMQTRIVTVDLGTGPDANPHSQDVVPASVPQAPGPPCGL